MIVDGGGDGGDFTYPLGEHLDVGAVVVVRGD